MLTKIVFKTFGVLLAFLGFSQSLESQKHSEVREAQYFSLFHFCNLSKLGRKSEASFENLNAQRGYCAIAKISFQNESMSASVNEFHSVSSSESVSEPLRSLYSVLTEVFNVRRLSWEVYSPDTQLRSLFRFTTRYLRVSTGLSPPDFSVENLFDQPTTIKA